MTWLSWSGAGLASSGPLLCHKRGHRLEGGSWAQVTAPTVHWKPRCEEASEGRHQARPLGSLETRCHPLSCVACCRPQTSFPFSQGSQGSLAGLQPEGQGGAASQAPPQDREGAGPRRGQTSFWWKGLKVPREARGAFMASSPQPGHLGTCPAVASPLAGPAAGSNPGPARSGCSFSAAFKGVPDPASGGALALGQPGRGWWPLGQGRNQWGKPGVSWSPRKASDVRWDGHVVPALWPQLLNLKHPSGAVEWVGFKRGDPGAGPIGRAGKGPGRAGALALMRGRRGPASAAEAEGHSVNRDFGKLLRTALDPHPVCRAGLLGYRGRRASFLPSENPQSEGRQALDEGHTWPRR